ncbi:MAG: hypothetical protein RLN70_06635, partial [Rhodospirillaceae bacterium]
VPAAVSPACPARRSFAPDLYTLRQPQGKPAPFRSSCQEVATDDLAATAAPAIGWAGPNDWPAVIRAEPPPPLRPRVVTGCNPGQVRPVESFFRHGAVLPCNPDVGLDIRVGGDVAEWSKALPC